MKIRRWRIINAELFTIIIGDLSVNDRIRFGQCHCLEIVALLQEKFSKVVIIPGKSILISFVILNECRGDKDNQDVSCQSIFFLLHFDLCQSLKGCKMPSILWLRLLFIFWVLLANLWTLGFFYCKHRREENRPAQNLRKNLSITAKHTRETKTFIRIWPPAPQDGENWILLDLPCAIKILICLIT